MLLLSLTLSVISLPNITIHTVRADGVDVFYRTAGAEKAPVLLLLHGFPTSSVSCRHLLDGLSDKYRVIVRAFVLIPPIKKEANFSLFQAPDYPGFGFTEVPADRQYQYTFDALAKTVEAFTDILGLRKYGLCIFDYGAPVGLR